MAAIFPTALGLAGVYFPTMVGTAISFVTTGGWFGAIVIPPAVGFVATPPRVRRGRGMLIPVICALLMVCATLLLMHAG